MSGCGWFCQECGHAFKTVAAAERECAHCDVSASGEHARRCPSVAVLSGASAHMAALAEGFEASIDKGGAS